MKHLLPPARLRRPHALAAMALAVISIGLTAGNASAAVTLDWTQASVYEFAGPPTLPKTWLGYVTSPAPPAGIATNGTATASGGATGPEVSSSSPRGVDQLYTFSYPAETGAIDPDSLEGALDFDGVVTFASPAPPAGHGFTISLEDPRLVLAGTTGELFASGVTSEGTGTYDRTEPVFDIDLTNAHWLLHADGTRELAGLAPAIATADYAFPANYAVGAGPDRTPNTFGSFSVSVAPDSGPAGPRGEAGPAGPKGETGPAGPTGKTVVERIQIAYLAKAPFGKGARKVRVLKNGKVVARGRVKGSTLKVRLAKGAGKRLKGNYVLRVVGGKGRAVVRLG